MANNKQVTVDQIEELARRADDRFIDESELGEVTKELDATNLGYGTCSTAAATAEKVITISGNEVWTLKPGRRITVKFSYTNTASNPTFNVNGTGAQPVWYDTDEIKTSNLSYAGYANRPMDFVYDGTRFVFAGWSVDANTTYGLATESEAGLMSAEDKAKLNKVDPDASGSKVYETTIPASGWSENEDTGVKSLTIAISGITANDTAKVDHSSASINGTSDSYAQFVEEENQYLSCITNGYAETYNGGIKFHIFGDPPTVAIPIIVEVG